MTRRTQATVASHPVLVGAVTVLVTVVAVFLAYNANSGLPFVPMYRVTVVLPDAAELNKGAEVRIGGSRVGQVQGITATETRAGRVSARVALSLDRNIGLLPRDTQVAVRQRSVLGAKYLELDPGRSRSKVPNGGMLAAKSAPVVDLDDVLGTFDRRTRAATRATVIELGDSVAGRGANVNQAVAALPGLLGHVTSVGSNLSSPRTELGSTVRAASSAVGAIYPEAHRLADLLDTSATTLAAVGSQRDALGQALADLPGTETTGTAALRTATPVLADTAALVRGAAPGVRVLEPASTRLASALATGAPVLDRTQPFADEASAVLRALTTVASDPATPGTLRELDRALPPLHQVLSFSNPFQTTCNYLGLWARNVDSVVSEGDALGTWMRVTALVKPNEMIPAAHPAADLHYLAYPDEGQHGQCEAGNETFVPGRQIGAIPGRQPDRTEATSPPPVGARP